MKKYIGIKIVLAAAMLAGEAFEKGYLRYAENQEHRNPNDEGYVVEYEDGYKSWCPKEVFEKANTEVKNETLAESARLMVSADYKERFKAEYIQLVNRYAGLRKMCDKWDKGELEFTPTCPREIYDRQLKAMDEYLNVLVERDAIEGINCICHDANCSC